MIAYPVAAVSMQRMPGTLDGHPRIARWAAEVGAQIRSEAGVAEAVRLIEACAEGFRK